MTWFLQNLILILSKLPLRLRIFLGRFIGFVFSLIPTKERKIAKLQMQSILGDQYSPKIISDMYRNMGQIIAEVINLDSFFKDKALHVECNNIALIQEMKSGSDAWVGLTAHTSNWDLFAAFLIDQKVPLMSIGREAQKKPLQKALSNIRERYGMNTIWRTDRSAVKQIIHEFREKHVVAALVDQDTDVRSTRVPFFGTPVNCPTTLIELGKRHSARIAIGFIWRTGYCSYKIEFDEIDASLSIQEIMLEYHRRLESGLRQHPEQWVWFHKRWRSCIEGSRMRSNKYIEFLEAGLLNHKKVALRS